MVWNRVFVSLRLNSNNRLGESLLLETVEECKDRVFVKEMMSFNLLSLYLCDSCFSHESLVVFGVALPLDWKV